MKSLIVLIVDHDAYKDEAFVPGEGTQELDDEVLLSFGGEANDMAAHWLGYEGWIVAKDAGDLLPDLSILNIPLPPDFFERRQQ